MSIAEIKTKITSSEDRGFLYLLLFFNHNEGVISPNQSPDLNKYMEKVQHSLFTFVEGIQAANKLISEKLCQKTNPFTNTQTDLPPLILKLILVQLVMLKFLTIEDEILKINPVLMNHTAGIFLDPNAYNNVVLNIFYLPPQITTNKNINLFFTVFEICEAFDYKIFLERFALKYFENADDEIKTLVDWLRQYSEDKDESFIRGFLGKVLFSRDEALKKPNVLSGGEKVRCMLSKMMLSGANVLLFDGPTAHLDLEGISAVNEGIKRFKGNVIFTSHDHEFIQTVANRIIEIDTSIVGDRDISYDEYVALKKAQSAPAKNL
mgnify:CR=1 FL=1